MIFFVREAPIVDKPAHLTIRFPRVLVSVCQIRSEKANREKVTLSTHSSSFQACSRVARLDPRDWRLCLSVFSCSSSYFSHPAEYQGCARSNWCKHLFVCSLFLILIGGSVFCLFWITRWFLFWIGHMIVIAIARFTSFISASFFLRLWRDLFCLFGRRCHGMSRQAATLSLSFFLWLWRVLSCLFQPMCRLLFGNVTTSSIFITPAAPPRAPSLCMEDFIPQMKADKELNRKFWPDFTWLLNKYCLQMCFDFKPDF